MNRALKWWLVNGVLFAVLLAGYGFGVEGAKHFVIFSVGLLLGLSLLGLEESTQKTLAQKGRMVPKWASVSYDWVFLLVLVYAGEWWLIIPWLLHMIVTEAAYSKAEDAKSGTEAQS
jgi:hypothetical protein